jgi:HlyD family secretion protein
MSARRPGQRRLLGRGFARTLLAGALFAASQALLPDQLHALLALPALAQAPAETSAPAPARDAAQPAPTVTVARVAQACFTDQVPFMGTVVPAEEVVIGPEIEGGRVAEVLVEEGERVRSGQLLARLTPPPQAAGPGRPARIDVLAPADGIILSVGARIGVVASSASPEPLFRLARNGAAEIEALLPGARLGKVASGQGVRMRLPGQPELTGTVRLVSPEIDRQTRLGRIRIGLQEPPRTLRFGATVAGSIEAGRSCGLAVPVSALLSRGDETAVQRVQDGRVEARLVRLGLVEGGRAEVREGLAEGDLVVARAGAFLREGDAVRPRESPASEASTGATAGDP